MSTSLHGRALRAALVLGLSFAALTASASAASQQERLVVRGDATVTEGACDASGCEMQLTGGSFRGTLGSGAYAGKIKLRIPDGFANGEGGVCAPIHGQIVLGAGSPDRLTLALAGDSCQDGAGPFPQASFTGLAGWAVVKGTGKYAHARGFGSAAFLEDAADNDRMTLIGRIAR
jgi:hypothetical protein